MTDPTNGTGDVYFRAADPSSHGIFGLSQVRCPVYICTQMLEHQES